MNLRELVESVPDPELPFLTIGDLGMVRAVTRPAAPPATPSVESGSSAGSQSAVRVVLTPTFIGCPATEAIADDVRRALADAGYGDAEVILALSPPWSSDWITPEGRAKLESAGIAAPACIAGSSFEVAIAAPVRCPQCQSLRTRRRSEFGSTPCKMVYVCLACAEPFEAVKPI